MVIFSSTKFILLEIQVPRLFLLEYFLVELPVFCEVG